MNEQERGRSVDIAHVTHVTTHKQQELALFTYFLRTLSFLSSFILFLFILFFRMKVLPLTEQSSCVLNQPHLTRNFLIGYKSRTAVRVVYLRMGLQHYYKANTAGG